MGKIVNMRGEEVNYPPQYYQVAIDLPCGQYSAEQCEEIAQLINEFLIQANVYHTEPEITEIYE